MSERQTGTMTYRPAAGWRKMFGLITINRLKWSEMNSGTNHMNVSGCDCVDELMKHSSNDLLAHDFKGPVWRI